MLQYNAFVRVHVCKSTVVPVVFTVKKLSVLLIC